MENIECERFRIVTEMSTALGTTPLEVGDVFEVVADPADVSFDDVDGEVIEVLHESNFNLEDAEAVIPVVTKNEFLSNAERVDA